MTHPPDPTSSDLQTQLADYAAAPRGNRARRTWTVDELLPLLDPSAPVAAIAARIGVKRAVVTYELLRMRRAGLPVPTRPMGGQRSPRTIAIEDDLRSGMIVADVARKYGLTVPRVREIRIRAGIPPVTRSWSDQDRQFLITHQDRPVQDLAVLLNRSVRAVYGQRQQLIAQGRIRPKKVRRRKRAD